MTVDKVLLYAAALVFGIALVCACLALSPAKRVSVAAFLAVPQFFVAGLPVSVSDAWLAIMALTAIPDKRIRIGNRAFMTPVFALVLAYVLAQLWSESPFSQTNMLIIVRLLFFAVLGCYALSVATDDPKALLRSFRWAVPWILIQSVLTFAFRLSPALENQFLHSSLANVLVGPSASGLFNGFANNVLDPTKAGGLYVNANMASMFSGVAFFLALMAIRSGLSRWYYLVASVSYAAVWATGSKTGAALALILPIIALLIPRMSRGLSRLALLALALLLIPIMFSLPDIIASLFPEYTDDSITAFGSRSVLWDAAGVLFSGSPWLGLGFGGWAVNIAALLGFDNLPPHNMIIAAWANAGMLAAVAAVAFMVVVSWGFVKKIFTTSAAGVRQAATFAFCALVWVFIHGMGDNTTIYGETRTEYFAAIALACIYAGTAGTDSTKVPAGLTAPSPLLHQPTWSR